MKESAKAEMQSLKLSLLKKSWTTCVSVQFMFFLKKCMKEIDLGFWSNVRVTKRQSLELQISNENDNCLDVENASMCD